MENKVNGGPEKQATRRVVLIVDDEPVNLEIAVSAVEDLENVKTVKFADSTEAKAFLEANRVDVLITDLQMPVVTGLELAGIAKAKGVGKVIVMSGAIGDDEELQVKIAEVGAVALAKPFRVEQLKGIIKA